MIKSYPWPGNIRQLANTIERAVILEEDAMIREENFILPELGKRLAGQSPSVPQAEPTPLQAEAPQRLESLGESEKSLIFKALEESLWIQKDAAKILGISPRALNHKIKKFGITHARWRKNT